MRIPKPWIPAMAKRIAKALLEEEMVVADVSRDDLARHVEALIMQELGVEDRLNDEVREMLKQYEADIDRGKYDYRKLFDMTKQKLVRERGIIL